MFLPIQNISKKWADDLYNASGRMDIDREVYQYGLELLITNTITLSCILLASIFLQSIWYGILYLIVFCPLKATCGGFHASRWLYCCIFSTLYYAITALLEKFLSVSADHPWTWILILWISCIYILENAPVRNKRHPVGDTVLKKNKHIAICLLVVYAMVLTCGYLCVGALRVCNFIVLVIASIAINIILAKGGRKDG